jgi:nitroreductase
MSENKNMSVFEAISTRRSVRNFTDEIISRDTMDELIRLGTLAASASNLQPWAFLILQGKDEILKHDEPAKAKRLAVSASDDRYRKTLSNPDYRVFQNSSNMILIYGNANFPFYVNDCTLAAANIMLAAHAMGLGTCWIGLGADYLNSAEFKNKYKVEDGYELVCAMTIGYPASLVTKVPPRRKPIMFNQD